MHSFVISYEIRYANQACERPVIQLATWVMDLINAGSKVVKRKRLIFHKVSCCRI